MTPSMKAGAILLYLQSRYPTTFMEVEEEAITRIIAGGGRDREECAYCERGDVQGGHAHNCILNPRMEPQESKNCPDCERAMLYSDYHKEGRGVF